MTAVAKSPRPALAFATPLARTDYEAILGVQPASIDPTIYDADNRFSVMHRNSTNRFADITDGSQYTIMILECSARPYVYRAGRARNQFSNDQGIGWADSEGPFSLDGASADGSREGCGVNAGCNFAMNRKNDNEPYSFHTGGIMALFADGHVAFQSASMPIRTFAAFCTRAAADQIEVPQN
jgi:prepilin-type processing-associated H-X9-DG protein